FWHEKFPGRIYDLDYEKLTENQEEETKKLLAYCGLPWEEACLEFEKTDRAVKTASAVQVRKKMYKGSSQAWKKFEKHLGPLKSNLDIK
ncbi:MAG: sulfotransferase, partial [Betaproteobacteria bacterium]|nr:sulfotransferase [Betaproteobacteria bacterium]